jgi:hypothetical protein
MKCAAVWVPSALAANAPSVHEPICMGNVCQDAFQQSLAPAPYVCLRTPASIDETYVYGIGTIWKTHPLTAQDQHCMGWKVPPLGT